MSRFPLGPSLCRGSLLRLGGRLSRLLRPGGRLSRLLRPGGRLSRLLGPGGRLSPLLRPGGRLSPLLRPGGRLSHLLSPGGRLSRLLRPGGCLSRLLRPGGRLSRLLRPGGRLTCQSHLTSPPTCQSHLTSLLSLPPCPGGLLSHWLHMDLALRPTSAPPPSWIMLCVKRLEAALRGGGGGGGGGGSVMNLVTTHYNCTSPMDYISHHALHSHIPIHHHTNHTAVTNHSFALIASPHLHLIHTLTYKQHTYTHPLRSLVLHWLTFWAFPLFSPGLPIYTDRLLPAFWPCLPLDILSVCHLPRPLHCPCCWFCLAFITPVTTFDHCLSDHPLSVLKLQLDLTSLPLRYKFSTHMPCDTRFLCICFGCVHSENCISEVLTNMVWNSWFQVQPRGLKRCVRTKWAYDMRKQFSMHISGFIKNKHAANMYGHSRFHAYKLFWSEE